MNIFDRLLAAMNAFRGKSARQTTELNQLLDFLGIDHNADRDALNEAV